MSRSIKIFIDSSLPLERLAEDLKLVLHLDFQQRQDRDETYFEAVGAPAYMTFGTHDFENDGDLHFQNYRFDLSIEAPYPPEGEESPTSEEVLSRRIYDVLRASGRYRIMLVDNLQSKIEQFSPV